jgi:hypothetical protein
MVTSTARCECYTGLQDDSDVNSIPISFLIIECIAIITSMANSKAWKLVHDSAPLPYILRLIVLTESSAQIQSSLTELNLAQALLASIYRKRAKYSEILRETNRSALQGFNELSYIHVHRNCFHSASTPIA